MPFHLYFYGRIVRLYIKGGFFSDLNWYHINLNEISLANKGIVIINYCNQFSTVDCYTSVLMSFSRYNPSKRIFN